ncbi:prophage regulatory protein [Novosphingobium hassiacum]|uniref:Prophage regulatory protein n=1 Tax=Novosphingobium hassiacum TaxID=173676 RepID=A0A7W6EXM2_9SPHN|nr:AlpA family transcriptional regulator [Novosphingobium hassiacum]MBB3861994.1 prophage regulatory protein [Novosphingobium hassiacum]
MTAVPQNEDIAVSGVEVTPPPARLLRLPEVIARVGMKRSAIYQRMSEGRFPKSRSLGAKCAVWVEAEINAWIDEIATRRP